jgi:arylsulfatase A-like enzyme
VGGYSDARTPAIEGISADGVRFERFYAASTYTLPSHMSMLTGLDPIEHGVVNQPSRLGPDVPTLATELGKAGYRTKAVVEGGFVDAGFGFDRGFSEFTDVPGRKGLAKTSIWGVLDWMRAQGGEPYFLFLQTYMAHAPYDGFEDFRNRHPELDLPDDQEIKQLKAKYNREGPYPASRDIPAELRFMCTFHNLNAAEFEHWLGCGDLFFKPDFLESEHFETYRRGTLEAHRAAIRRADFMVGQVRDVLIELDQLDDTLFIVTSDHGEGMFEHGIHEHDYLPYDEVVKVPLVLSYPRGVDAGQIVRGLTWHLDLFPTVLSLAGVPFNSDLLGEDLTPIVTKGDRIDPDRAIHPVLLRPANRAHLPMRRMSIKGDFKYIEGDQNYGDPDGMLFNLKASPDEDRNLRHSDPKRFAELRELALDYDGSLTPGEPVHRETGDPISPFPGTVEPLEYSDELRESLAELGYIMDAESEE